jgi:proteasome lid subunit RPN8/RPN11
VEGLKKYIDDVAEITAKQLQYVGEWHSHPRGCNSEPSDIDRAAVANLKLVLGREGYPAIALIVSEDPHPYVLFDQWL